MEDILMGCIVASGHIRILLDLINITGVTQPIKECELFQKLDQ